MSDIASVLELIKQQNAEYVSFRFTDLRGKWHHLSYHASAVDEDLLRVREEITALFHVMRV